MVMAVSQYQSGAKIMATPWDSFIDAIEKRKTQLDDLLASYADFRKKLAALPPEIALEAQQMLAASDAAKLEEGAATRQDMIGKAALECAKIILEERGNEPTHFSAIAKAAMARGYRGRAEGSQEEVESRVQNSFWAALHRSENFVGTGKGCYRLHVPAAEGLSANTLERVMVGMTQKEAATRILQELDRPAKVDEILQEAIRRQWITVTSTERNVSNSLYGMMMRNDKIFVRVEPGTFDLVESVRHHRFE